MYTTCPACHRHYRIMAKQLSAAGGVVRCGFCGEQFNALTRLEDEVTAGVRPEPAAPRRTACQGCNSSLDRWHSLARRTAHHTICLVQQGLSHEHLARIEALGKQTM